MPRSRLGRCSAEHPQRLPSAEAACVCQVVKSTGFPAGPEGRRVGFDALSYDDDPRDRSGQRVMVSIGQVDSPAVGLTRADTGLHQHAPATCLAKARQAAAVELTVH